MAYIRQSFLDPEIVNISNDEILENEVSLARWIADSTLLLFSEDESCNYQEKFYIPELKAHYIPDLYFRKGLKALDLQGRTIIQLKENLLETEISQVNLYEYLIKEELVDRIIVVFIHSDVEIKERSSNNCNVQFEEGTLFINKIKDAIKKDKGKILPEIRKRNIPKTWRDDREEILTKAINDYNRYNSVLFIGAGVSASAKLPNWNSLLKQLLPNEEIIKESDFDEIFKEMDYSNLVMARYIQKTLKKSELSSVTDKIRSVFYSQNKRKKSKLVSEICRMIIKQKNVRSVITYNYDTLIEETLKKRRRRCFSVYRNNRDENNSFPIYHVHGIIFPEINSNQIEEVVLSEEDYHRIYSEVFDWSNVEQLHALTRCTCYFIGLSMKDPNLRRLLEIAKRDSGTAVRHYVFLERKSFTTDSQKSKLDFQIRENIMADLGLNVIWYEGDNNHKELPELLKRFTSTK